MDEITKHFSEVAQQARTDAAGGAATILDCRRDDEWEEGHVPGALHWDLERLRGGTFPEIPKDRRVYVYCAAGGRAAQAIELMRQEGWTDLRNMGGLNDWMRVGGAVEY